MSTIELTGDYEFSVKRADTEEGEIIFTLEVGEDTVTFSPGRSASDAEDLYSELQDLTSAANEIVTEWKDKPDTENDGFVSSGRGGYFATLSGKTRPDGRQGYPSQDIATYELARMLAAEPGWTPNTWYEGERGIADTINTEVYAHIGDDDKLKPLPGVRYQPGASVLMNHPGWITHSFTVDADYGDLGVMVHTSGDPSMTELATHDQLTPRDDEDED